MAIESENINEMTYNIKGQTSRNFPNTYIRLFTFPQR